MSRTTETISDSKAIGSLWHLLCRRGLAIALVLMLSAGLAATRSVAQAVDATLRGTVRDTSGASIVGAKVVLTEPSTGQVVRQVVSSESGDFEFDELKPGTYALHCDAPGFKGFKAESILLDPGQIRRVDPALPVGALTDEVVVTAGAAVINTEDATISTTFSAKDNDRTPLINTYPSAYSLLTTAAGVQGGHGSTPVFDGQQQQNQSQIFDGIPNDLQGQQTNNSNFFDESTAVTSNAPAESAVPAEISLVTHRGSNSFHGVASYKIYDSVLNASTYLPPAKTPYINHEWNIGVGGPIWKDRAFFYGQWFAERIPLGSNYLINVPSPLMRQGVFTQFTTAIKDPLTGLAFTNNTIPSNRISPVALAIQNTFYPVPTAAYANSLPVNNYPFTFNSYSDLFKADWLMDRVDVNLSKNNSMFFRWLLRDTPYLLNDGVPSAIWTRVRRQQQYAMGDTHIFSSHLANNFRLGLEYDYEVDGTPERGVTPPNGAAVLAAVGLQGSNPSNSIGQGLPNITINGGGVTTAQIHDDAGGVQFDNTVITISDAVDWQVRHHVLKFGFISQRYNNSQGFLNDYGTFVFNGTYSGNAYADFLLGIPQSSARTTPLPTRHQITGNLGFYAQDDYQATKKLTINFGLRWDYYGTPYSPNHLAYNWDPTTGDVIVDPSAVSLVSPLYPSNITVVTGPVQAIPDKANFTPRLGAAYRLSDHSVLRGGYGIYTSRFETPQTSTVPSAFPTFLYNPFELINPQLTAGVTGPFSISQNYVNVVAPGQTPLLQFPNPYPSSTSTAPSQDVYGYPRQSTLGMIQQFSVSYEREVHSFGLRASYVGSRTSGMNYQVNIDQPVASTTPYTSALLPYKQFAHTYETYYNGSAKYDGLQLEATRRAGNFTFHANYSFQRSIANDLNIENPYNVLSHWANDGPTMRHYGAISASYALPFGKGQEYLSQGSPIIGRLAGGWVVTSLTYMGSGIWYSPYFPTGDPSNTGTVGGLPDRIGNPYSFPGGKARLEAFNPAAFAVPLSGKYGNALPNSLEGQRLYLTHLGILKTIPINNRVTFNFNTEISNLFNHPEFQPPFQGNISVAGGNFYSTQLATFTSLERGGPRQITFQGAFRF
ncbi:carboxypeptidase regulatory-like domain-containing protein [Granulicella arctica]|uniref:TonB-dependent transporter Oar-like beta-barrel domain-containing protein n=1 Tax=Granulicella arctica TaxID=940613 RepID=A0A7Y9PIQ2_9BACT|nr:carboxypeptidase regulatory-like domain-containing protein [Granulicella arctica]NYF80645.1 hypothetical protein [Granulicella arctica]